MAVSKEQVLSALAKVASPTGETLPDARVLSDIVVSDGKVFFSMTVDAATVKAWEPVREAAEKAVRAIPGVQSALVALTAVDAVKHVIVVDSDVNVYREEDVLWALATRVQADQDIDIIKNIKSTPLDPSLQHDVLGAKMIVDATRPVVRPFEARIEVPLEAVNAVDPERLIPAEQLARLRLPR
jgi:metal-sulfur cluster biosynthetic enzyme